MSQFFQGFVIVGPSKTDSETIRMGTQKEKHKPRNQMGNHEAIEHIQEEKRNLQPVPRRKTLNNHKQKQHTQQPNRTHQGGYGLDTGSVDPS